MFGVVLLAGLPAGLQHAQPAHPPQERQLPPPRLQLQPQARQDAHHQGAQEVALRQRLPPLPRDPAADQARGGLARPVQVRPTSIYL